jgi:uncharacterized alpha-E superfamily protein
MLSRVAESLYWMSRYLERAEHTARLIDVDLQLGLDESPDSSSERWLRLLSALQTPLSLADTIDAASMAHSLTFDRTNSSSIISCIAAARENLRHVREQCSSDMWEQLNRLYLHIVGTSPADPWAVNSHQLFRSVQDGAHVFHGVTDSTMCHGEGWQYIQLGRYVERADALASLIGTHFEQVPHSLTQAVESEAYLEWVGLLKWCTAFEAYCKTYTAELSPIRIAEFLLLNPEFPHSVRYSVDRVHSALNVIGEWTGRKSGSPLRLAGRLRATLSFSQIEEILAGSAHAYTDSIRRQCTLVHIAIHQIYFDYPIESTMAA